jgi:hypothetical protein
MRYVPDHERLGLPLNSTEDVIKQRLRQLQRVHHPDRGGDAETFAVINAAGERMLAIARGSYASVFASFFGRASSSSSNIRTELDMTPAEMEAKLRREDADAKERIARMVATDEMNEQLELERLQDEQRREALETDEMESWDFDVGTSRLVWSNS